MELDLHIKYLEQMLINIFSGTEYSLSFPFGPCVCISFEEETHFSAQAVPQ
jgi:hypothetical protein